MPNDFTMTNNTSSNRWDLTYTVDASGTKEKILATAGTYVDKNIKVAITTPSATPAFDGGALNNKAASATGTNVTLVSTNNSGVSILAKGTAGREAVLYNGAVNGFVSAADDAVVSAAVASSTWDGTSYYLKEVTIAKPSSGSREFGVVVPNGDSTLTFVFHVDSSGNVTVDNEYSLTY